VCVYVCVCVSVCVLERKRRESARLCFYLLPASRPVLILVELARSRLVQLREIILNTELHRILCLVSSCETTFRSSLSVNIPTEPSVLAAPDIRFQLAALQQFLGRPSQSAGDRRGIVATAGTCLISIGDGLKIACRIKIGRSDTS